MSGIVEKVGQRIRALRDTRGLTQAVLAERSDLAPHTVSRIERGEQGPSLEALERLARALGVPLAELFDFEGERVRGRDPVDAVLDALPEGGEALRVRLRAALTILIKNDNA